MANMSNLNCILVLDESVRPKMKTNISDLVIYNIDIINDITEITEEMYNKTKKVIILGAYRYNGIEDLKLYKELLGLEYYFISDDKTMVSLLRDFCKCSYLDYTIVNSNMLASVLYNDLGEQIKYEVDPKSLMESDLVDEFMHKNSNDVIKSICASYLRLRELLDTKIEDEHGHLSTIRKYEAKMLSYEQQIAFLSNSYEDLLEQVIVQTRTLKDYSTVLTQDFYKTIQVSKYKNRPKILYLREYEELLHSESFLNTLCTAIRVQGNLSCKLVRVHDSSDLVRIKTLEDRYKVINEKFIESDVITADKILAYGNYEKLLDLLLTNKYTLDVLVLVDCKNYKEFSSIVAGGGVTTINLCRNIHNLATLGLSEVNTVTSNSDSSLSWDTYTDYDQFTEDRERFEFLASRTVINRIYRMVKEM